MPSIIAQFKGLDIYPWVFSAYLLAATVTTPLYGKLADIWGRKPVLLFGLVVFCIGSALSGLATSMGMLIFMRVIQGIGAGAVSPIVLTLLGDLFDLRERARVQSLFSGVWGVSSLAGPALGGYLTVQLSWRWVFFVSVPFGVVSMIILWWFVEEPEAKRRRVAPLDWPGALLLAGSTSALLFALLDGPQRSTAATVGWSIAAAVLLALFIRQERRAVDPMLHLDLLFRGPVLAALIGSFVVGGLLFCMDTYIPLYIQGAMGGNAWSAGKVLTPLFLSWAVSVFLAANVVARWGFRTTGRVGATAVCVGSLGLVAATYVPESAVAIFQASMIVIGLGMGPTSLSQILSVQTVVPWERRGAATGAVTFGRTI
jgi:multidrug resistance protein